MKLNKIIATTLPAMLLAYLAISITWPKSDLTPNAQANQDQGFVSLFNGKDFTGWDQRGGKAQYTIKNNQIIGKTVKNTPNSFLTTEKHYDNFILELEYKVDPKLNSGIQIRSNSDPAHRNGQVHGYQIEIDPSPRAWSAGIYEEARRGWLFKLDKNKPAQKAFKQNQWNHYKIKCQGNRIQTWINGVPAADFTETNPIGYKTGFIGLQVHRHKKAGLKIAWRNIKIKELK